MTHVHFTLTPLRRRVVGILCSSACAGLALAATSVAAAAAAPTAPDGDWPMAPRDHANTRFSPLTDIDRSNVARLQVAFTFDTGVRRGQEAAPIIAGDTMYVVTAYPNILY